MTVWMYVIGRNATRASADAVAADPDAQCHPSTRITGSPTEIGDRAMDSPQVSHQVVDPGRRGCLVEGCPCRDARIVSKRRTAFFAAWAQQHGETANRLVTPELGWRIPTLTIAAI
jgi:hypothetical protein